MIKTNLYVTWLLKTVCWRLYGSRLDVDGQPRYQTLLLIQKFSLKRNKFHFDFSKLTFPASITKTTKPALRNALKPDICWSALLNTALVESRVTAILNQISR